jgi:hypothetical protein
VQGLVEGPTGGVAPLSENVDRHLIESDGNKHGSLVGGQHLGDRIAQGFDQLVRFRPCRRARASIGLQPRQLVGIERQLASLPGTPPRLHRGLEDRELVRPRREAAVAAVGRELPENRNECIVRGLHREIVDVTRRGQSRRRPSPDELEPGRVQQQRMETLDGVLALVSA